MPKVIAIFVALIAYVLPPALAENVVPPSGSPKFLSLPYEDSPIELRQGWIYDSGGFKFSCPTDLYPADVRTHCGIDFFKGLVSDRKTFEVVAAAPGCTSRIDTTGFAGTFVVIAHDAVAPGGSAFYTRYLHLDPSRVASFIPTAPQCARVGRGASIGWASNSGIPQQPIHLHFDVVIGGYTNDLVVTNRVDPYDIAGGLFSLGQLPTKDKYPPNDPSATCGPNHLWLTCPGSVAQGDENADAALIIDSSGSMNFFDPLDKRLEAARAFLAAAVPGDQVAIVDFDSGSRIASPLLRLPEGRQGLLDAIATIDSAGGTNIGLGIQTGCDTLLASPSGNSIGFAILLTDGFGAFGGQDGCFKDRNWPIYTFGIGNADAALLAQIADNTGGEFKSLPTTNLICEFQAVRSKVAGQQVSPCTSTFILQDQRIILTRDIPSGQSTATFSSSWIGSDVVMTLTSPSGRVINRYLLGPDVQYDSGAAFEILTINGPEPGEWGIELFGADIPPSGEELVFGFTTIPKKFTPVLIDITPGGYPNAINPKKKGVIPVAVLGTSQFDIASIDTSTLAFGAGLAPIRHKRGHVEDVNFDGIPDLILHFSSQEIGIQCGAMSAMLTGESIDGDEIRGTDAITTVGCDRN